MKSVVRKTKTIYIGEDAYVFLQKMEKISRGGFWNDDLAEFWKKRFQKCYLINGLRQVNDGDFGGGNGKNPNSWTEWSVDYVKKLLDENGYKYEIGEDQEVIDIYF